MDNSCSLKIDRVVSLCNAKRHMKEIYWGVCVIPLSYFTFLYHNELVDSEVPGGLMTAGWQSGMYSEGQEATSEKYEISVHFNKGLQIIMISTIDQSEGYFLNRFMVLSK